MTDAIGQEIAAMSDKFARHVKLLELTERLPLPQLARLQEELLTRLVRHARTTLPFYRERLACLFGADGQADLSRWNDVPILDRADVIAHGKAMRVRDLSAIYGGVREMHTSGSTGPPLEFAVNELASFSINAEMMRVARWFGLDTSRPLAMIRRFPADERPLYPEGRTERGWSFAHGDAPVYQLELLTPVDQQLEWLSRRKAPYLVTQASGAMALADAVTPEQGRALGIEAVIFAGETVPDEAPDLVAERLGARSVAIYSCQEIGPIATQCPTARHYHVACENAFVEILDDRGRDVTPGERGRVVVTGLHNFAMPFIRYAIGDVALAGTGPCSCGRTLPVIARVEGRTRNVFVFRDGTRFWPRRELIRRMRPFVAFKDFQLVQLDHERIEFRYVPEDAARHPDLAGLTQLARQILHPSVEITLVALAALPRAGSGKFEPFVSLIAK